MPPGHHELERSAIGVAEQADALAPSPAARVVHQLAVVALVPTRVDQALEDRSNQRALITREEVGVERGPRDVPVGRDACAQQPAVAVHMIPAEGDFVALRSGEASVQLPRQGLWRITDGGQPNAGPTQRGSGKGAAAQALQEASAVELHAALLGSQLGALIALSGAEFLSVFEKPELDAVAYLFIRLNSWGIQIIQIFWGLWLFPFGILVYRSGFIPRILGVLLMIAGFGYLLGSFMFQILPQYDDALSTFIMVLEMGELPIIFWLLIVGAKAQSEERQIRP